MVWDGKRFLLLSAMVDGMFLTAIDSDGAVPVSFLRLPLNDGRTDSDQEFGAPRLLPLGNNAYLVGYHVNPRQRARSTVIAKFRLVPK